MTNEIERFKNNGSDSVKLSDLQYILEVNKKAIEIQIETVRQNSEITITLEVLKKSLLNAEEEFTEFQKNEINKEINQKLILKDSDITHESILMNLKEFKDYITSLQNNIINLQTFAQSNRVSIDRIDEKIKSNSDEFLEKIDIVIDKNSEIAKDFHTIKILMSTGVLSVILQIILFIVDKLVLKK